MDPLKDWSFWPAVRAEARRTWLNRWLWLWIPCLLALEAWLLSDRNEEWLSPRFHVLCDIAVLVPVWLCADLLSLRFRGNPEPHREWPPRAFLARALGRLLPFWLALLPLTITLTSFTLGHELHHPRPSMGWDNPHFVYRSSGPIRVVVSWVVWNAVFPISALPFAAWAAALSATARRPRRWLIALAVNLVMMAVGCVAALWVEPLGADGLADALGSRLRLAAPSVWIGYAAGNGLELTGIFLGNPTSQELPGLTFLACCAFVAYALPPFALTWWIAARRFRRHPYTLSMDEAAPEQAA